MTARDFCYWLQSAFELSGAIDFDKKQTEIIKNHLAMVFYHEIDPSHGDQEHQGKLSEIHQGNMTDLKNSIVPNSAFVNTGYTLNSLDPKSTVKYRC